MSLEPTAPCPAPAFTADEERPIIGRPFLVPLYVPHFTARSRPCVLPTPYSTLPEGLWITPLFTGVRGSGILRSSTPMRQGPETVASQDPQRTRKHCPTASAAIIPCPGTLSRSNPRIRRSLSLPAIHHYRVDERH